MWKKTISIIVSSLHKNSEAVFPDELPRVHDLCSVRCGNKIRK